MLSILMPVYNERERVERAISEVLATTLPTEFELIVVDDGSTDGTREMLGNKGVTLACNMLFNVYLHDIMTCHKMLRTELFRSLALHSQGFAIEPEITARLVQRRERVFEVPVHYRARATEEGKKLTALDG